MESNEELLAEINITPLTDIIMVLLIIFLVTATAITQTGFNITLPKAQAAQVIEKAPLEIFITHQGVVYLGANQVDDRRLKKYLKEFHLKNYRNVIIKGDEKISYGKVVELMGLVKACGFENIALGVEKL